MIGGEICTYDDFKNRWLASKLHIVGWKTKELRFAEVNALGQKFYQFKSPKQVIGLRDCDTSWRELSDVFEKQDIFCLKNVGAQYNIDAPLCFDNVKRYSLTQKIPILENGKICGVGFIALPLEISQLMIFIRMLFHHTRGANQKTPLIVNTKQKYFYYKNLSLTRAEARCLSYALRGLSVPEIAVKLNRSKRTVEAHFDELRGKIGCTKHSILFEKAVEYGFIDLIFMEII